MDPMPPDPLTAILQFQYLVLIIIGVFLPLLTLLRAAEDGEIVLLCLGLVACTAYLASAWLYGLEVMLGGGWTFTVIGVALLTREVIRNGLDRTRSRYRRPHDPPGRP